MVAKQLEDESTYKMLRLAKWHHRQWLREHEARSWR